MNPELDYLTRLLRTVAATEIMPRFDRVRSQAKADGSLVTDADLAVQARIAEAIARDFPGSALLGEEMTPSEQAGLLADQQGAIWILDPLDGTSNYACGLPGFAISIALMEGGEARLGVILDPVRDECFTVAAGALATLNGERIRPYAPGPELGDCLAMVDLKRVPPGRIPALFRPGGFRSQRNLGSVALDWCWLAAGRYQLYLHGGQKLWDYAAGHLIASTAGAATRLFERPGRLPAQGLSLEPRLAIAAADAGLLERWLAFVDLPLVDG